MTIEAPIPCITLEIINIVIFGEMLHKKEPNINTIIPYKKTLPFPFKSPNFPNIIIVVATVIIYDYTIKLESDKFMPRSFFIDGKTTLTILASKLPIKGTTINTNCIIHLFL